MRRYTHEITTTLPPGRLFRAIADIARWPEWDGELESTTSSSIRCARAPVSP